MPLHLRTIAFLILSSFLFVAESSAQPPQAPMGMGKHENGSPTPQLNEGRTVLAFGADKLGACPKTLDDWKAWRKGKFMELLSSRTFEMLSIRDGEFELQTGGSLKSFLEKCRPGQEKIHDLPEFKACFEKMLKLEEIAGTFLTLVESAAGQVPIDSVKGFPDTYTAKNLKEVADNLAPEKLDKLRTALSTLTKGTKEYKVIRFESGIIPKLNSLVILDRRESGKQFWTHFTDSSSAEEFLSLDVTPGKKAPEGTINYQFHTLKHDGLMRRPPTDAATCIQCHRTGPISLVAKDRKNIEVIHPRDPKAQKDGFAVMTEMNEAIGEVALSLPKGFRMDVFGTTRGPTKARPIEYLRRLAQKTSTPAVDDATLSKVAPQMNCKSCHDEKTTAHAIGHQLLVPELFDNYVLTGHMPPQENLSATERKLLNELLVIEQMGGYTNKDNTGKEAGTFGDWLNESCPWTK